MEWLSKVKKYVKTFSFKNKQKLINTLTYDGSDMCEDEEMYKQIYDMIKQEEKIGEHNTDPNSITNMLIKLSKDINGGVNYVFKSMILLIRWLQQLDVLFAQSFLDYYPVATIDHDMDVYKMNFRQTVISAATHIFGSHTKITWVEGKNKGEELAHEKTSKLIVFIEHHMNMFSKSNKPFELISEIAEWNELLDDEAFMIIYWYWLRMGISAYRSIIDYCNMINEIADDIEVTYNQIDKILTWLESLIEESKKFHFNVNMYQYFLKENDITESAEFKDDKNQYS